MVRVSFSPVGKMFIKDLIYVRFNSKKNSFRTKHDPLISWGGESSHKIFIPVPKKLTDS